MKVLPPIERIFTKEQMKEMLGGVSNSTYYRLLRSRELGFTRRGRGGEVVHTETHWREFVSYLDSNTVPVVQKYPRRARY